MKSFLTILFFVSISILIYPQDLLTPIDYIVTESNNQSYPTSSLQSYVSSVNLTGNFHELIIVVGFSDKDYGYPTLQTSDFYPLIGIFPDGTLLKDYVAQNGGSIPADQWYEPLLNYYYTAVSGGLYNVDFQFVKSTNNGGTYLSDHSFSYWVTQNGGSSNSVVYNKRSLILREIAEKLYNDNPNIFNAISCIHFIFQGVNNCEFYKYTAVKCAGGTIDNNITLKNISGTVTYWTGPVSYQKNMSAVLHERFHIIGKISSHPNFTGFPDRGNDIFPDGVHRNMLWDRDMMYHNASLPGLHSLYGQVPLLSHDLIFLGWIKPEEILTVNQSNINSINFNNIKLADVNYPLATQSIANGYRRIIKVMIKENYSGDRDEYFLIEYHNASQFDKSFENLDEYPTYGYNKGILIWHIKELTDMINQSFDNLIQLETAVPYNGWYGNPIPNDDYPRDYNRPSSWNGIYSGDFNYLDDDIVDSNNRLIHLPDGGRHIWETTVINDPNNTYGWDPTGQRRFFRFQSMRSDFFTDENIRGHITNSITDATRPSTKTWGSTTEPSEKTHIAITNITRQPGYMALKVYYNYWEGNITSNSTMSGNVIIGNNLTVASGVTLTIQPGTNLIFSNGASLIVNGILNAVGTSSNKITFTSQSGTTNSSWGTITLSGSGASGSTLKYANVKYGTKVEAKNSSNITIQYCNIDTTYDGVRFYNSSGSILNNTITTNSIGHGIIIENGSTNVTVNDNVIKKTYTDRRGVGIYFGGGAGGSAVRNDIYGWDWGICAIWSSSPTSYSQQVIQKNNRIRNCNTGLTVYRLSYPTFGIPAPSDYYNLNSISGNSYNAKVGTYYPEYESRLFACNNWWGSNIPNTALFQVGDSSQFYYNPYLSSDPWAGIPKMVAENTESPTTVNKISQTANTEIDLLLYGVELRLQNKYNEAKNYFVSYIAKHPDNQQAYVELYNCYNQETADEIIKFFSSLPEKASKDHKLLLSHLYLKNGDFKDAKEINNSIIAENPNTELATKAKLNNVYIALYNEDNINEAITTFNDALSKSKLSTPMELSLVHNAIETYANTYGKEISGLAPLPYFESSEQDLVKQEGLKKIGVPDIYELLGNFPNPFNPSTTISYALPYQSSVELIIYDVMGREVKSFNVSSQSAGYNRLVWDGRNESGDPITSGVYFYRISIKSLENNETFIKTAKLMMMK